MNKKFYTVEAADTDDLFLYLTVDGQPYRIRWENCSEKLSEATPLQRQIIEISPSGYGLHWTMLDEDLALSPLLNCAERILNAVNS